MSSQPINERTQISVEAEPERSPRRSHVEEPEKAREQIGGAAGKAASRDVAGTIFRAATETDSVIKPPVSIGDKTSGSCAGADSARSTPKRERGYSPRSAPTTQHTNSTERPSSVEPPETHSVEPPAIGRDYIGSIAGTATSREDGGSVFKREINPSDIIKTPLSELAGKGAEVIKESAAEKLLSKMENGKKPGVFSKALHTAERGMFAPAPGEDLEIKAGQTAAKYGYKATKGAAVAVGVGMRGASRHYRLNKALEKDVAAGIYTSEVAKQIAHKSAKAGMLRSGARMGASIKTTAVTAVEDWQSNDDLGTQAITKPKNLVIDTRRSVKTIKNIRSSVKARRATRRAKKAAEAAKTGGNVIQRVATLVKGGATKVFAALSSSSVLGIAAGALGLLAVVAVVIAIIPSGSVKSEDSDLTAAYKYVTELDYNFYESVTGYQYTSYDVITYYLNGMEIPAQSLEITTNADLMLMYLDLKYEDYTFDDNIRNEVEALHAMLYSVTTNVYAITTTFEGEPVTNPETGEEEAFYYDVTVTYMDVYISVQSLDSYINLNMDSLLDADQQEMMELSYEVGMYTARQELGNPFLDKDYIATGRFGYRKHPVTGAMQDHTGIDISMSGGTEVVNVLSGTVDSIYYDGEYGNTVVVVAGEKEVRYSHLGTMSVSVGQFVGVKERIGSVGSSGNINESCLHIEYRKDGEILNPQFYLEGCLSNGSPITGVSWLTDEKLYEFAERCGVTLSPYLSEARKNILKAAATGVLANIPYHYTWRSYYRLLPGVPDNLFGSTVPADSKGRNRKGTDCSGFVCWAYYTAGIYPSGWSWNGDETTGWSFVATPGILSSSSMERIAASSLQPGDVGLINGTAGTTDHTGIFLGRTSTGAQMWMHCSGSRGAICSNYTGFYITIRMRGLT